MRSALVLLLVVTAPALAQPESLPAAPAPILGRPVPVVPPAPPTPLTYAPPPPAPPQGTVVPPAYDPGRDGWGPFGCASAAPGWFADAEVAVIFPAVKFRVTNDQPLPFTGLRLDVPSAGLDVTVMPTFELGYRLGESCGFFAFATSFFLTEGTGTRTNNLGTFDVKTRAEAYWWNLDYGTTPFEFLPRWEVSWRIGARITDVYFDSRGVNDVLTQKASSEFFGAGPHARFDIERRIIPVPGLAVFGRVDGAAFIGRVTQRYTANLLGVEDTLSVTRSQLVPYLNLQAGLSYAPPGLPGVKFTGGYMFEDYFNAGRLGVDNTGEVSQSRGELWSHGFFLRGQIDF